MNDTAQIITSLATLVASIGALLVGWRNSRQIEAVHIATNSLTDRLVQTTKTEATAKGNLQGRAELKSEQTRAKSPNK